MSSQWVQHISGQGEKWEVAEDHPSWMTPDAYPNPNIEWLVYGNPRGRLAKRFAQHLLPKSEYVLCDPPEQWVDVTHEMTEDEVRCEIERWPHSYRLRKVRVFAGDGPTQSMWAFIVEKQVRP